MSATDIPLTSSDWLEKFNRLINKRDGKYAEHEFARDALRRLENSGVPKDDILLNLYFYSHPDVGQSRGSHRKEAEGLAYQLKQLVPALEQTAIRMETIAPLTWRTDLESDAIDSLRIAAQSLKPLMKHYQDVSSKYKQRRCAATLTHLWIVIKQITGRSHWEDLAYLLEVAFEAGGEKLECEPEAVRKIVTRYLQSHPELHGFSELRIAQGQSPSSKTGTRSTRNRRTPKGGASTPPQYIGV